MIDKLLFERVYRFQYKQTFRICIYYVYILNLLVHGDNTL